MPIYTIPDTPASAHSAALAALAAAWSSSMAATMRSMVVDSSGNTLISRVEHERYGLYANGATPSYGSGLSAAAIQGGGMTITGSPVLSNGIVTSIKNTVWAIGVRVKFPQPTTSQYSVLGLQNGAFGVQFGTSYGIGSVGDYDAHTNYIVAVSKTPGTGGNTTNIVTSLGWTDAYHDWCLGFDGTTLKVAIDGALVASTGVLDNFPNLIGSIGSSANAALYFTDIMVGW
jgi:hypothetical protein